MKKFNLIFTTLILFSFFFSTNSFAQEFNESLPYFNKVQASSHIDVILKKGEKEHVKIEYSGVDADKINYVVKGKTLQIYLDGAKVSDKTEKVIRDGHKQNVSFYEGAKITAYVTFKELKELEIRGERSAVCKDSINAKKFTIKLFGQTNVDLAHLNAERFKGKLYGENHLKIKSGELVKQKYALFGENIVETENIPGNRIVVNSYGENKVYVNAEKLIRIFGLGEFKMNHAGKADLRKLIIGESRIEKDI